MTNKSRGVFTSGEETIIQEAWEKKNPSIFLNHFVKPPDGGYMVYPGSVRHAQYLSAWKAAGMPASFVAESAEIRFEVAPKFGDYRKDAGMADQPKAQENQIAFFEKRGYVLLPWQLEFFRAPQGQRTVIGTAGIGKTNGVGMLAMYYCATLPHFKFLMAYYCPPLWRLYDLGTREGTKKDYYSVTVLHRENPYITNSLM